MAALGLSVDILVLDVDVPEILLGYDVIEFIGGNPFYLLDAIRKSDAKEVLMDCAQHRLLIGLSAAAFVFGPTLELVNRYSPEMNFLCLEDLNGLSLTDIQTLPHYSKFLQKFSDFEKICLDYKETHNISVLRLNDGDGVLIDGKDILILRKE